jgi:hypothetical protein
MTTRRAPRRHWRSDGSEPLPTGAEALDEPFSAFPSWFMRVTCDRCGKDRMISETHPHKAMREALRMRRYNLAGQIVRV